jgi:hypothetical protein
MPSLLFQFHCTSFPAAYSVLFRASPSLKLYFGHPSLDPCYLNCLLNHTVEIPFYINETCFLSLTFQIFNSKFISPWLPAELVKNFVSVPWNVVSSLIKASLYRRCRLE